MHLKMKYFLGLLSIAIFVGCSAPHGSDLKKAEWMLGTWENRTDRGSVYEHWEEKNPHEFAGKSYMLRDGDTVVFETIRLVEEDGGLVYIPMVGDQNEGLPVRFGSKLITDQKMVFENKEHDFPQEISYHRVSGDSLVAQIRGLRNGAEDERVFPMRRVK